MIRIFVVVAIFFSVNISAKEVVFSTADNASIQADFTLRGPVSTHVKLI